MPVTKIVALFISSELPCPIDITALLWTRLQSTGKLIMPILSQLSLQEVRFRDLYGYEDNHFVAELCVTLEARRILGRRKLEKLSIKNGFSMNKDDVTKLQKVVDVNWDGEVQYDEAEDEDEYREFMEEDDSSDLEEA
ncbi:hypothetical protein EUX98_g6494 [Antrodiella citrinella]|uniref:Uncharacterized protein n=1 Tax=Antrodiella citrinella TaxID=2447956 RepID=A0A4S4MNU5_9APHY|nr:hypothetical protein EUX98_g6494 [Antrodiella citrinella]